MTNEQRLASLNLVLPAAPAPAAVYKPVVIAGGLAWVSGHGPVCSDGSLIRGRVGSDLSLDEGYAAARQQAGAGPHCCYQARHRANISGRTTR